MSICRVISDYVYTIPTEVGGANKDTAADTSEWATRGYFFVDDKTNPKLDPANGPSVCDVEQWYVALSSMFNWANLGQELENYLIYHRLADPNKPCPYSVDTGEPGWVQENWFEWGVVGASHAPVEIPEGSGVWYRSSLYGVQGTPLLASTFYTYVQNPNTNQTGISEIITIWDFQQIQAANQPPTP